MILDKECSKLVIKMIQMLGSYKDEENERNAQKVLKIIVEMPYDAPEVEIRFKDNLKHFYSVKIVIMAYEKS